MSLHCFYCRGPEALTAWMTPGAVFRPKMRSHREACVCWTVVESNHTTLEGGLRALKVRVLPIRPFLLCRPKCLRDDK